MTKRDLFIVLIRIFGLLVVIRMLFSTLPMTLSYSFQDFSFWQLVWILSLSALTVGMFALLVLKTGKIVDILRLERGFEEDRIELGPINPVVIVRIGIFLIGGILIIHNITSFLTDLFVLFSIRAGSNQFIGSMTTPVYHGLGVSSINLLLGYFLVTRYSDIARWFSKGDDQKEA